MDADGSDGSDNDTCLQPSKREGRTMVEVTQESSLHAAWRLVCELDEAKRPPGVAVLNFASGKTPGGGFKGGSMAQEESLAYCSALHPTQMQFFDRLYAPHRKEDKKALHTL